MRLCESTGMSVVHGNLLLVCFGIVEDVKVNASKVAIWSGILRQSTWTSFTWLRLVALDIELLHSVFLHSN